MQHQHTHIAGRNDGTIPLRQDGEIVVIRVPGKDGKEVDMTQFRATGTTVKKNHGVFAG